MLWGIGSLSKKIMIYLEQNTKDLLKITKKSAEVIEVSKACPKIQKIQTHKKIISAQRTMFEFC